MPNEGNVLNWRRVERRKEEGGRREEGEEQCDSGTSCICDAGYSPSGGLTCFRMSGRRVEGGGKRGGGEERRRLRRGEEERRSNGGSNEARDERKERG
jgi:hypothetical protein